MAALEVYFYMQYLRFFIVYVYFVLYEEIICVFYLLTIREHWHSQGVGLGGMRFPSLSFKHLIWTSDVFKINISGVSKYLQNCSQLSLSNESWIP